MAFDVSTNISLSRNGLSLGAVASTISTDQLIEHNENIAQSTTDHNIPIAIDVSEADLVYIVGDQAFTLETNSASVPIQTLTFEADKPILWFTGMSGANPLTTDVTAFFITVGAVGTAGLNLSFVIGQSPP